MKLKRGQKLCKKCNNINGARAHTCKHCNNEFVSGANSKTKKVKIKKPKKYEDIDWTLLQKGDKIKVIGRSGNYYVGEDGEKTYLSDRGIYSVYAQDSNGLIVYSSDGGFGYIYMGKEEQSNLMPNMYRSPHKIVKVNIPVRA
jgi:hypothetical protein